jgi:hypothetical protein
MRSIQFTNLLADVIRFSFNAEILMAPSECNIQRAIASALNQASRSTKQMVAELKGVLARGGNHLSSQLLDKTYKLIADLIAVR